MDLKTTLTHDKIELPNNFFQNIQKYKEHLFKWNKIHNLTGAKSEQTINEFIYDAVFPVSFLPKVDSLLDIGTGAGFPGMILAFALPHTEVTLVEPLTKRASFLQFVKADLGLDNVQVVKKRVEEMQPKVFDLITSRAVTDTKMLLRLSKNFRDAHSKLLFYKGEKVFDEIETDIDIKHKIIETKNRHYLLLGEEL
ncbi:16S rRNA (guanine(527)-N(7))-methyltransferase RsmG [Sulfurimonas sediminis]|uniref:Ribosomal RNA small subunit methyltransferase G n=1 Tax=Sulfurimonas sediminis TaxID=2590020 RepID=A0A7M1AZK2_9BACT|nr:16S rRNA (guanine(527)-N(7))-methyltransferase RsmG [Sulfurimonas sediminis]QOP42805.1 16S rRNA (guanine(527)-N(7))-methyltransferase RsmG [Sulfurimonas sediminis]